MLVLTRKSQQQIRIGDNITISVLKIKGNAVSVGIDAPRNVRVVRAELPIHEAPPAAPSAAATAATESSSAGPGGPAESAGRTGDNSFQAFVKQRRAGGPRACGGSSSSAQALMPHYR